MNPFRLLFFIFLFCLPAFAALAQTPTIDWARQAGSTNVDEGLAIATDAAGYSYVTGYFRTTATFGTTQVTSAGDEDIFIAKYTPAGRLVWVRRAGGTGRDQGTGIALDNAGNLVISGVFQGSANFQTTATTVTSAGASDILVAKFDTAGTFVWARSAGSTADDQGSGIATDGQTIYITGEFQGTASFSGSPVVSAGLLDIFIARYSSTGTLSWVKRAGGTTNDRGRGISADASGNVYLTGDFELTSSFGNNSLTADGTGSDIFVAKYDAAGNDLWVNRAGSPNANDQGFALDTDASGNAYVTGFFQGTAIFEGSSPAVSLTVTGNQDIFIARYDAFGGLLWAVKGGSSGIDIGRGISVDQAGNALVTGSFNNSLTFSGTTTTTASLTPSSNSLDVFVVKYNSSGAVQEALRAGGNTADFGHAIATDQIGRGYFTGSFTGGPAAFGSTNLSTNTLAEIFTARFVPSALLLPVELVFFKAAVADLKVVLTWQTASETDNDYFMVERSADGRQFEPVIKVKGAGSATGIKTYQATDLQPLPGTSYYRLRQTDFDGTTTYSPVAAVTFKAAVSPPLSELTVFPNPAAGMVIIGYNAASLQVITLRITDMLGRVITERAITNQTGNNRIPMNLQGIRPGLYLVQLQSGNLLLTEKLVLE